MTVATTARRPFRLAALGLVAVLALAACSGDDDSGDSADDSADSAVDADDSADNAELDAAVERADDAEAQVESLTASLEAVEAEAEAADAELLAANESNVELAAQVTAETTRADEAEAQVTKFTDMFPVVVESTLDGIELEQAGTYDLKWAEAYCDTFSTCGQLPATKTATFVKTPDNFLRVVVDGILDAGLFAVDGSLYGITDSQTALPPCPDGTPRTARITITTYADFISVDAEGNRTVDGLAGSITVDSPSIGDCPGGLVFYGVTMTPVG